MTHKLNVSRLGRVLNHLFTVLLVMFDAQITRRYGHNDTWIRLPVMATLTSRGIGTTHTVSTTDHNKLGG